MGEFHLINLKKYGTKKDVIHYVDCEKAAGQSLRDNWRQISNTNSSISWQVMGITSDLSETAIDGYLASGHKAAVLRRQKGSHSPNFRRIGHALERVERGEKLHTLLT